VEKGTEPDRKDRPAVANIESQDKQVDPFNKLTIEGLKEYNFNQFDTLSIATAANLATAEGIESELTMEGEHFGNGMFDREMSGGVPKTLGDLVDMLDIKEISGTAVSSDIQHFSAFASDDMWPI